MAEHAIEIIEGPSFEEVIKSLTTCGQAKHLVRFKLPHEDRHARVFSMSDTGTRDIDQASDVYHVYVAHEPLIGHGLAHAIATYYVHAKKWGVWRPQFDF